jgi:hypothetical protein
MQGTPQAEVESLLSSPEMLESLLELPELLELPKLL